MKVGPVWVSEPGVWHPLSTVTAQKSLERWAAVALESSPALLGPGGEESAAAATESLSEAWNGGTEWGCGGWQEPHCS